MPETHISINRGVAGQIAADVPELGLGFIGSAYGGPVVCVLPSGAQTFVSDPGRFGRFESDPKGWVAQFIAEGREN